MSVVIEETIKIKPFDSASVSHIVTEDDEPVDNMFSAKQQRLMVESIYSSKPIRWPFLADANVGVFRSPYLPPLVPDVFLSLDVEVHENWYAKEHRSYFLWEFGKPPDVVVEIVSNKKGGEAGKKVRVYAQMGVWYYVIYDPQQLIQDEFLRVYKLRAGRYVLKSDWWLDSVGLGVTLWEGEFEGVWEQWLRWCDQDGNVISTGAELAKWQRERAERLAAQLRVLGIEPEV
ncbi:MAG: Uma2 family endonuclease [Anaerolineales bacterium]